MERMMEELQDTPDRCLLVYLRHVANHELNLVTTEFTLVQAMQPALLAVWQNWAHQPVLQVPADVLQTVAYLSRLVCAADSLQPHGLPLPFLIRVIAGATAVQSLVLREAVFRVVEALPLTAFVELSTTALLPDLVAWACAILVDFPKMDLRQKKITLLLLSHLERMPGINLCAARPYLFEQAMHRLLAIAQEIHTEQQQQQKLLTPSMCIVLAFELFSWYSIAQPFRNVVESVFWTFTTVVNQTQQYRLLSGQHRLLHQSLQAGLGTPGNRRTAYRLWQLCEPTEMAGWRFILPMLKTLTISPASDTEMHDPISQQRALQLYKFAPADAGGVSVETMVHHFATNGWNNPFTNLSVTWADLCAANPTWSQTL